ncbi:unnamed protein product [Cuscuta europaea]|uniref:Uncharacterized protein n=1 Tax=Cuscuta europaea TaxID=41803 RepID=A0A9P0Z175_CUSEU|nr:unnamed protein product [Cuscuta europaea]
MENSSAEEEGVAAPRGRVQIDTTKPFRSVKEAVLLFGDRILGPEIFAKQVTTLHQVHTERVIGVGEKQTRLGAVKAELEDAKKGLEKAKEEELFMAHCLQSLREELEQTKREIQQLKAAAKYGHHNKQVAFLDPEIEELKFIEKALPNREVDTGHDNEEVELFERKRSVKFASPLGLTRVITPPIDYSVTESDPEKTSSPSQDKKKLKRKHLIPLMGALFAKKKQNQ